LRGKLLTAEKVEKIRRERGEKRLTAKDAKKGREEREEKRTTDTQRHGEIGRSGYRVNGI